MQYTHASNIGAKPIHYGAVVDMISSKYLDRETLFVSGFKLSIICLFMMYGYPKGIYLRYEERDSLFAKLAEKYLI